MGGFSAHADFFSIMDSMGKQVAHPTELSSLRKQGSRNMAVYVDSRFRGNENENVEE
jgi:hypothetical protein